MGRYTDRRTARAPGVNDVYGEASGPEQPAPDFEIKTIDGNTLRLSDYAGKVVMVDFWASWCSPCQVEGPVLANAYLNWKDLGVEFIGVAIWDDMGGVRQFMERNRTMFPLGIDEQGTVAISYGVKGIPEKFFIGADGRVLKKVIGPMTARQLDNLLSQLTASSARRRGGVPGLPGAVWQESGA